MLAGEWELGFLFCFFAPGKQKKMDGLMEINHQIIRLVQHSHQRYTFHEILQRIDTTDMAALESSFGVHLNFIRHAYRHVVDIQTTEYYYELLQ